MTGSSNSSPGIAQGDLRLLDSPVARRLLAAPVPSRLAITGLDDTPRIIPINSHWTGDELVMGAFPGTHKMRRWGPDPTSRSASTPPTAGPKRSFSVAGSR